MTKKKTKVLLFSKGREVSILKNLMFLRYLQVFSVVETVHKQFIVSTTYFLLHVSSSKLSIFD